MDWKKNIKGVIFDLDGVIVDTAKFHYKAWKALADKLGIDFSEEQNENLKGMSRMDSLNYILSLGELQNMLEDDKRKLAASKNLYYLELIEELDESDILPGTMNWIQECKQNGIKISLGSASKNARRILDGLNLTDHFDAIIDGTNTTETKPHPQVFLLAAKALNVEPSECVVIEDAYKGLEAARKGGFYSIGIGDPEILKIADINLTSLADESMDVLEQL
ncbi:beta-phosphoglucomutase [Portibacter marinus]|uniref:beta-phosphoglucomutase n=1 Tax=Portibacter marinus TaxID=2898660 RepID=UPI001F1C6B51|nr:beta-phosphoglucomutase [Portibacter marinus]